MGLAQTRAPPTGMCVPLHTLSRALGRLSIKNHTILDVRSYEGRTSLGPGLPILVRGARFWTLGCPSLLEVHAFEPCRQWRGGARFWLCVVHPLWGSHHVVGWGAGGVGCVRHATKRLSVYASRLSV